MSTTSMQFLFSETPALVWSAPASVDKSLHIVTRESRCKFKTVKHGAQSGPSVYGETPEGSLHGLLAWRSQWHVHYIPISTCWLYINEGIRSELGHSNEDVMSWNSGAYEVIH